MRTATKRRSRVLPFWRMALLSAIAVAPFLTLLAPERSGATAPPRSISAAAAAPAGRPAPTATPRVVDGTIGAAQATGDRRQATVPASSPMAQVRQARASRDHSRTQRRASVTARHSVGYDRYSLLIDGHRVALFGGEYQLWRTP